MPWTIRRVASYDSVFQKLLLYRHACSSNQFSCVHINDKALPLSGIPNVKLPLAQPPTAHTLTAQFFPIIWSAFSHLLFVKGNFLSVPHLENWPKYKINMAAWNTTSFHTKLSYHRPTHPRCSSAKLKYKVLPHCFELSTDMKPQGNH